MACCPFWRGLNWPLHTRNAALDGYMRKLAFQHAFRAARWSVALMIVAAAALGGVAQGSESNSNPAVRPEFLEPVTLTSKDGLLEVRLTARQGQARLDTVAVPVQNLLLFDYELIHGTASAGRSSGGELYPAPTLKVFPGERLVVHFENGLSDLTIRDYFSPQYVPRGEPVPIFPEQMTSSPINLHTHGLHISPKGNADNVLLHIPPGMSNTYTYDMPPKADELANGTYRPLLTPVNFSQSKVGTKYATVWYAGPLSIRNTRGRFQFIPSNLQHFTAADGKVNSDVPADSSLPDYQRDVQFTVNGQFQPVINSKAGQTEIWVRSEEHTSELQSRQYLVCR